MSTRGTVLFSIAFPIITVGLFVIAVFTALDYENLTLEVYAIFALVAIFLFLFGFAIGQKFVSPIRQLIDKADKLNRGELDSRVYLETKDEFGELAEAFNKVAEKLQNNRAEMAQAEDVTDVKIRAKTKELEETVDNLEQKVRGRAQELQKMILESQQLQDLVKSRETEVVELKKELRALSGTQEKKGGTGKKL